ncbi:MAG: uracil-DNA glycosylase family protein, partial [Lachnospiraceae bacterium]|nr:uracil-DNA glycosylase family protein [Lachnospiraceae bacterium]
PLSPSTNSGSLLCEVESKCTDVPMYRTNLVKCAPLNESGKLRYPNRKEIDSCLPHLGFELEELAPQIVFLLGGKVIDAVSRYFSVEFEKWNGFNYSYKKHDKLYFVPVHHPSYIYVYKRKMIDYYISGLEKMINQLI